MTRAEQRTAKAQREADAFNAKCPVGTPVRYWSGLKEGEPTGTGEIEHPATVMCDHAVAWIQGARSCHSITHVEALKTAELTGSDPDFTGDMSTDEYIRSIRGR
jgi:hypothetical protein